ncbi:hypothetical protein D3C84_1049810 [compost metagenome]
MQYVDQPLLPGDPLLIRHGARDIIDANGQQRHIEGLRYVLLEQFQQRLRVQAGFRPECPADPVLRGQKADHLAA